MEQQLVQEMPHTSPKSPMPTYNEENVLTPAEWSDLSLEQSMFQFAETLVTKDIQKLERLKINEDFRLVHETVYPNHKI